MHANTQFKEAVLQLVPGGDSSLAHLSDGELLLTTRRLVGTSNRLCAALLLHLAEVETRGIHRTRACASLYTYCVHELRMSEDAAARRSSAARWVKRFPLLIHAIANGELHLTGLLMLGPHLTLKNHVEVLARAKFRTKKEIAKLVRELHPLPRLPDVMDPLGPELSPAASNPTWEHWVTSLCPPVRELQPGERPEDWANDTGLLESAETTDTPTSGLAVTVLEKDVDDVDAGPISDPLSAAPARHEQPPVTGPQQYQMQFCTTEEHVKLVERAKALLARTSPGASLGELHLQAMQLLVAQLEKQRFAVSDRARMVKPSTAQGRASRQCDSEAHVRHAPPAQPSKAPRRRGRHVPAAVKREVFVRDAGCCSYVDERGERCRETHYLELHHLQPYAQGGGQVAANLTLRCAAHNALAAEEDFGRDLVECKRDSATHESFAAATRPKRGPGAGRREPDA